MAAACPQNWFLLKLATNSCDVHDRFASGLGEGVDENARDGVTIVIEEAAIVSEGIGDSALIS